MSTVFLHPSSEDGRKRLKKRCFKPLLSESSSYAAWFRTWSDKENCICLQTSKHNYLHPYQPCISLMFYVSPLGQWIWTSTSLWEWILGHDVFPKHFMTKSISVLHFALFLQFYQSWKWWLHCIAFTLLWFLLSSKFDKFREILQNVNSSDFPDGLVVFILTYPDFCTHVGWWGECISDCEVCINEILWKWNPNEFCEYKSRIHLILGAWFKSATSVPVQIGKFFLWTVAWGYWLLNCWI